NDSRDNHRLELAREFSGGLRGFKPFSQQVSKADIPDSINLRSSRSFRTSLDMLLAMRQRRGVAGLSSSSRTVLKSARTPSFIIGSDNKAATLVRPTVSR